MRICRLVFWFYVALAVASLMVLIVGVMGLLGVEKDPLAAAYAIILAQPWLTLTSGLTSGDSVILSLAHVMACQALNAAIIHLACRLFRRRDGRHRRG